MAFKKFNEDQASTLDQVQALQKLLVHCELTDMLAKIRLSFAEQAHAELMQDPRFLEQDEGIRVAVLSAIAETQSTELSHRADVLPWLQDTPSRIAALLKKLDNDNNRNGGAHV